MPAYHINVAPHTGCGIGFISIGENENHALAELSLSLRQRLKIIRAQLSVLPSHSSSYKERDLERYLEILRTIRKPGRHCPKTDFYKEYLWEKVTVIKITKAVTAAYVEEVWLGTKL